MITNRRSYFLNQLKLSSSGRRFYFDAQITSSVKPLALLLQSLNVIRRFHKLDPAKNVYRVFPTYSRHRKQARTMVLYARKSGHIILNYQALRLLRFNTPHSYYIVETSQGVMTHEEAVQNKIGGSLLLIIH